MDHQGNINEDDLFKISKRKNHSTLESFKFNKAITNFTEERYVPISEITKNHLRSYYMKEALNKYQTVITDQIREEVENKI